MLSSILLSYAKKQKLLSMCDKLVQWDALLDEDQVDTHHCGMFVYDVKHVHKKFTSDMHWISPADCATHSDFLKHFYGWWNWRIVTSGRNNCTKYMDTNLLSTFVHCGVNLQRLLVSHRLFKYQWKNMEHDDTIGPGE